MSGWFQNTEPSRYVLDIYGALGGLREVETTPSNRVVLTLQAENPSIKTKEFRKSVLSSIFDDAVEQHFNDKDYEERYVRRLKRWAGKNYRQRLIESCEILSTWRYRDARFVPDAYLIDSENSTIVCYEVEDSHPLNPFSIGEYGAAWWTLEYIFWDLHLIAYDIYGNSRVIALPHSEFMARHERKTRE